MIIRLMCFALFNVEGEFTKVSKATKAIWGYEQHELLGKSANYLVRPDDVSLTIQSVKTLRQEKAKLTLKTGKSIKTVL